MAATQEPTTSEVPPFAIENGQLSKEAKVESRDPAASANASTIQPNHSESNYKPEHQEHNETHESKPSNHGQATEAAQVGNDLDTGVKHPEEREAEGHKAKGTEPKPDTTQHKQDSTKEEPTKDAPGGETGDKPAGGYDATPIPDMPPGYTIRITIHKAENLPMADMNSLSSDPYVISQLYNSNTTRHKEDPAIKMRTFTVRRDINPVWNAPWVLANVPTSGFRLKCRIYDEDPADHDDRLGNVHIHVSNINESYKGFKDKKFKVKKRMGSKRAYAVQAIAKTIGKRDHIDGFLYVSIENLGRTESQHGGRIYTAAPAFFIKHYSPLLGRAMGQKTPGSDDKKNEKKENSERPQTGRTKSEEAQKAKTERFNFQANQMQLNGPVPAELYHRYVEFRPFVRRMFTGKGLRGFLMNKVLIHQHNQIYHFDRSTEYGYLDDKPTKETTLKFLDLVHYDTGGRIFTYIITLDSLMRFTETGKEFGIQMLSKHSLHSAAETYIAFSGEFLVRRLKHGNEPPPEEGGNNQSHPSDDFSGGPPDGDPPKDPSKYELIIDNDSGTYRPNAEMLPKLKQFLEHTLPGLHVHVLDCQKDADEQQRIKKEQLEKKKKEGRPMVYKRISRGSSISSSDESDLDDLVGGEGDSQNDFLKTIKRDFTARGKQKGAHYRNLAKGNKKKRGDAPQTTEAVKEKEEEGGKGKAAVQTNGSAAQASEEVKA